MGMAYGAVSRLLFVRGPWDWVWCGFYVSVSIGLMQLYQSARVATIAVAILNICLIGVALVKGLRHWGPVVLLPVLPRLLLYAFIVLYLLLPKIGVAFNAASDGRIRAAEKA
jgi:hypothetical protein